MAKLYRVMKKGNDDRPVVADTCGLGVRVPQDIKPSPTDSVSPGTGGMSVSSGPAGLSLHFVPKRLRHARPGAIGNNSGFIWSFGSGGFSASPIPPHLSFRPTSASHGLVEPHDDMALEDYRGALAATGGHWKVDE
jgi:hypothetical protein